MYKDANSFGGSPEKRNQWDKNIGKGNFGSLSPGKNITSDADSRIREEIREEERR